MGDSKPVQLVRWCRECEKQTLHEVDGPCLKCDKKKWGPVEKQWNKNNNKENDMKKSSKKKTASKKSTTKKTTDRQGQLSRAEKSEIAQKTIATIQDNHPDLKMKTIRQIALTMYVAAGKKS